MKKNFFSLPLNGKDQLRITFPVCEEDLTPFVDARIELLKGKSRTIFIDDDCVMGTLSEIQGLLKKAIDNKLPIHESIQNDIGFLWNEELNQSPGLTYEKCEGRDYWVGLKNLLASPSNGTSFWLFNKNNTIFLEMTPVYRWHFLAPKKNENYIPYKIFKNNYHPDLIIEIERAKAVSIANACDRWFKIIDQNYKNMKQ